MLRSTRAEEESLDEDSDFDEPVRSRPRKAHRASRDEVLNGDEDEDPKPRSRKREPTEDDDALGFEVARLPRAALAMPARAGSRSRAPPRIRRSAPARTPPSDPRGRRS